MNRFYNRSTVLLAAALIIGGCAQPAQGNNAPASSQEAAVSDAPRVYFIEPADGAELTSPLTLKFGAASFIVEPATAGSTAGHGHLHVMVDHDCIPAGQGIPKDETHIHYGQGQLESEFELTPGEHKLCLQAADGNHMALAGDGMTQVITVQVK